MRKIQKLTTETRRHGEKLFTIKHDRINKSLFEGNQKQRLNHRGHGEKQRSQKRSRSKEFRMCIHCAATDVFTGRSTLRTTASRSETPYGFTMHRTLAA